MKAINVKNLTKRYGDFTAVDNISFGAEKGSLTGFLGVNGAGKTTTINMISTLIAPTAGTIEICGCDSRKDAESIRRRIGIVYQNNVLDDVLTVRENLICRGLIHGAARSEADRNLDELCTMFSIGDILRKPYRALSGGQKRRCEIAAALMHTPELLILDEPTTGLDPGARAEVWNTVEMLRKNTEMTVFLTTHYMEEAAGADDIIIIDRGHITAQGKPHELKERYASDLLKIYCRGDVSARVMDIAGEGISERTSSGVKVRIRSSMDALPLLNRLNGMIDGFEVVQGTLDDVFLSVTKQAV